MPNPPSSPKTRSERVASVAPHRSWYARFVDFVRNAKGVSRIALCALVALLWWLILAGWAPPFEFRLGDLPRRDVTARVSFYVVNPQKTEEERRRRRSEALLIYRNDARPIDELRTTLKNSLLKLADDQKAAAAGSSADQFFQPRKQENSLATPMDRSRVIERLKELFGDEESRSKWGQALEAAFEPVRKNGVLAELEHEPQDGSQLAIRIYPEGRRAETRQVAVEEVEPGSQMAAIETRLASELAQAGFADDDTKLLVNLTMNWLAAKGLPDTLHRDDRASAEVYAELEKLPLVQDLFEPGDHLAAAYHPLSRESLALLKAEHEAWIARRGHWQAIGYSLASFGLYAAVFVLCGVYIAFNEPTLLEDFRRILATLALTVLTVAGARLVAADAIRAELAPLLLFGMALRVVFPRELSMLLAGVLTVVVVLGLGEGLGETVIYIAVVFAAQLCLNRVHTRTKLLYVGISAGVVACLTTLGVGTLTEQTYGVAGTWRWWQEPEVGMITATDFLLRLGSGATWYIFVSILSGLIMTGLLPFVERCFDVQTDMSLLELGDPRHPLMQELAERAPGTFSHSLTVASLGEAAAQAIHANGLLVRVGAYFHDIGKMLNPGYFVENQQAGLNRHDALAPAMSTLVIIAHVKDGVNLAQQHRLPQTIIDFIEQHHGTTVVEFFYREAAKRAEADPELPRVEETDFRYPGPKPQTRETAVLMIADTAESATRTLVDPAPARIRTLVHDLIMKKLEDGQFDECDLTLAELAQIEDSLVKSLTALYHGRVKYPTESEKRA